MICIPMIPKASVRYSSADSPVKLALTVRFPIEEKQVLGNDAKKVKDLVELLILKEEGMASQVDLIDFDDKKSGVSVTSMLLEGGLDKTMLTAFIRG